jgi:hypothetical protein
MDVMSDEEYQGIIDHLAVILNEAQGIPSPRERIEPRSDPPVVAHTVTATISGTGYASTIKVPVFKAQQAGDLWTTTMGDGTRVTVLKS